MIHIHIGQQFDSLRYSVHCIGSINLFCCGGKGLALIWEASVKDMDNIPYLYYCWSWKELLHLVICPFSPMNMASVVYLKSIPQINYSHQTRAPNVSFTPVLAMSWWPWEKYRKRESYPFNVFLIACIAVFIYLMIANNSPYFFLFLLNYWPQLKERGRLAACRSMWLWVCFGKVSLRIALMAPAKMTTQYDE